ncbi:MAG: capsid cement protein [Opitutaceae bacterium]
MSKEGNNLQIIGAKAAGAITEDVFVKIASGTAYPGELVVDEAGAGEAILGVSCNEAAAAGDTVEVAIQGIGKLVTLDGTPGSVTPGAQLKAAAGGTAVLTTDALTNTGGRALATSSTAGAKIPIMIEPHSSVKAAS